MKCQHQVQSFTNKRRVHSEFLHKLLQFLLKYELDVGSSCLIASTVNHHYKSDIVNVKCSYFVYFFEALHVLDNPPGLDLILFAFH